MMFETYDANIWDKYRKSNNYLQDNCLIDRARWYWNMYLGDQWDGLKVNKNVKVPVLNFTKQVVDYKTAAVGQNQMTVVFSDPKGQHDEIYDMLNDFWKARWKKEDMDNKMYEVVLESGIQGDSYIYFGTHEQSQIMPNTSILLADEQNADLQSQAYIMIRQRLFVRDVIAAAQANGILDTSNILADKEDDYIVGNKEDIDYKDGEGKCTAVIYFEKKDGMVWTGKAVKGCVYEPMHPLATTGGENVLFSSKYYPIVQLPCSTYPNSARGRGWVEDIIPNQIEVNKTYARASAAIKNTAFPRIAYNANMINNPEDLDNVGAPIECDGDAQTISAMIQYLQGQPMTGDVFNYADDLFTKTKMVAGASDAITGISDPTRVSGSAISEIREQSTLTLKGNVIRLKKCYEDIARVRLDTWQTYYPMGIDVQRTPTPEEQQAIDNGQFVDLNEHIDGDTLRALMPDIEIDVSLQTEATKDGTQAILDNLRDSQFITFEEWVNLSDGNGQVPKAKLMKLLQQRKQQQQMQQVNGQVDQNGQPIQNVQQPQNQPVPTGNS